MEKQTCMQQKMSAWDKIKRRQQPNKHGTHKTQSRWRENRIFPLNCSCRSEDLSEKWIWCRKALSEGIGESSKMECRVTEMPADFILRESHANWTLSYSGTISKLKSGFDQLHSHEINYIYVQLQIRSIEDWNRRFRHNTRMCLQLSKAGKPFSRTKECTSSPKARAPNVVRHTFCWSLFSDHQIFLNFWGPCFFARSAYA